jgi:hypothetical protein
MEDLGKDEDPFVVTEGSGLEVGALIRQTLNG